MPTVVALAQDLERRRQELKLQFDKCRNDAGELVMDQAQLAEVRGRNEELERLDTEWRAARDAEDLAERNDLALRKIRTAPELPHGGGGGGAAAAGSRIDRRSLGEVIMAQPSIARWRAGMPPAMFADPEFDMRRVLGSAVERRALFETGAGWDPEDLRTGRVILDAMQQVPVVANIIPKTTTKMSTVLYMEETTYTTGAAEVSEGGTYGEASLVVTEQSSEVRKIGVSLPVTDEQFEDEVRARDYVGSRLGNMLRQRLDLQILVGNGTAPNLMGINNVGGINTNAKGADPTFDAVLKGIVECRVVGFAEPDYIIIHPNDWQDIRLTRTADGIYIMGNPADPGPMRLWGKPVIETTYQTENTAVVGDFGNYSELALRRGIEVMVSNSHSTFFTEGKQMIRADFRTALLFYRPAAFCTVTGI